MATHIKHVLGGFLKDKKKDLKKRDQIEKIIEEELGEKVKKHISLKRIYKNNLILHSDSSNYSFSFYLKKENMLKKIKKKFPEIEDIKIKAS